MEDIAPALIGLTMMATIFGIVYYFLTYRNKERLALIESGADADLFYSKKKKTTTPFTLSLGMVSVGLAVGIALGAIIEAIILAIKDDPDGEFPQAYFAMIFLGVGLALIKSYQMSKKYEKEEKENQIEKK